MKLLFDQNLSRRLLPELESLFPGSSQVAWCGLDTASNAALWDFARTEDFAPVSKGAALLELALFRGFPPKVILLNLGNVSNTRILEVLLAQAEYIQGFLQSGAQGVLEID